MTIKTSFAIVGLLATSIATYGFIQNRKAPSCQAKIIETKIQKPQFLYYVGGDYTRGITKQEAINAQKLSDIIMDYPQNWIENYQRVIISTNKTSSEGNGETLNEHQKLLLKNSTIGTDISISVIYQRKNSLTENIDTHELKTEYTIIPETEASYLGGKSNLDNYLKLNSENTIQNMDLSNLKAGSILFDIDLNGNITNVVIDRTSGYKSIDNLMVKLIKNMNQWTPAKNFKGESVSQRFRYNFGAGGC